jgi:hypothetical protein
MGAQQIHAAVLHGIGQTPRYERFRRRWPATAKPS